MSVSPHKTLSSTNPLSVQFWLWGQDALRGDLAALGFRKTPNPSAGKGSSIYRKGQVGLHSSAAWLESAEGVIVYSRAREVFFWLKSPEGLPELPKERACLVQPLALEFSLGLARLQPFVSVYEGWIFERYGSNYSRSYPKLPSAAALPGRPGFTQGHSARASLLPICQGPPQHDKRNLAWNSLIWSGNKEIGMR